MLFSVHAPSPSVLLSIYIVFTLSKSTLRSFEPCLYNALHLQVSPTSNLKPELHALPSPCNSKKEFSVEFVYDDSMTSMSGYVLLVGRLRWVAFWYRFDPISNGSRLRGSPAGVPHQRFHRGIYLSLTHGSFLFIPFFKKCAPLFLRTLTDLFWLFSE